MQEEEEEEEEEEEHMPYISETNIVHKALHKSATHTSLLLCNS